MADMRMMSQANTNTSGVFACRRAAAVAAGVNPPGQRPQPRCPWVVAMSGAFRSTCACRQPVSRAHADAFRARHAGDAGGQSRPSSPLSVAAPPRLADGRLARPRSKIADAKRPVTTPAALAHSRTVQRPPPHRRIRVSCGDRRPQRESARTAPVGKRRHRAPAQRTAEQHGDDGGGAAPWSW
jgi:hypothetical protein